MKLTNITFNEINDELNISNTIVINKDTTVQMFIDSIDDEYVEELIRKDSDMICTLKNINFKLNNVYLKFRNNRISTIVSFIIVAIVYFLAIVMQLNLRGVWLGLGLNYFILSVGYIIKFYKGGNIHKNSNQLGESSIIRGDVIE